MRILFRDHSHQNCPAFQLLGRNSGNQGDWLPCKIVIVGRVLGRGGNREKAAATPVAANGDADDSPF